MRVPAIWVQMEIKFGLDWTANTAHTALLVAEGAGFNKELGFSVTFVEATDPSAPLTPLHGIVDGSLLFGLAPCDQILEEKHQADRILPVAALHDSDISALCVLKNSPVKRPADLEGKKYGSCGYAFEVDCIDGMIKHDGGKRGVVEVCPPVRPETETLLLDDKVDCVWMYRTWEVLRAAKAGIELREFVPGEYGVPFGYMNCIVASKEYLNSVDGAKTMRDFLFAVKKGAQFASEHPQEAAQIIASMVGSHGISPDGGLSNVDFNLQSIKRLIELKSLVPAQDTNRVWGEMDADRWTAFVQWVESLPHREISKTDVSSIFTNQYLSLRKN